VAACLAYWGLALWLVSAVPAIETFGIRVTMATVRGMLTLIGLATTRVGDTLIHGHTAIDIASDCSPHLPYLILAGAILAYPAAWRDRVLGLLAGAVLVHAFNTLRILALFFILLTRPEWFEVAHTYLWQIGTILVVFGSFAVWLRWVGREPAQ
jgi:exosortase/archaeosortase family protein